MSALGLHRDFAADEAAHMVGLPVARLRYWAQSGLIVPSVRGPNAARYGFRDLVALKVAARLLDDGMTLAQLRIALRQLKRLLGDAAQPLSTLRVRWNGQALMLEQDGRSLETSGQLVFDFAQDVAKHADVHALENTSAAAAPCTALQWFHLGQQAQEEGDRQTAMHAYTQATTRDPAMACAWVNLGMLHVDEGALALAQTAFERARAGEGAACEALLNLAELAAHQGDHATAEQLFGQVLDTFGEHAHAHYGRARSLLAMRGDGPLARAHLTRFVRAHACATDRSALEAAQTWLGLAPVDAPAFATLAP